MCKASMKFKFQHPYINLCSWCHPEYCPFDSLATFYCLELSSELSCEGCLKLPRISLRSGPLTFYFEFQYSLDLSHDGLSGSIALQMKLSYGLGYSSFLIVEEVVRQVSPLVFVFYYWLTFDFCWKEYS